jgi:hypothetical protein
MIMSIKMFKANRFYAGDSIVLGEVENTVPRGSI